jgi:hypothetical protein
VFTTTAVVLYVLLKQTAGQSEEFPSRFFGQNFRSSAAVIPHPRRSQLALFSSIDHADAQTLNRRKVSKNEVVPAGDPLLEEFLTSIAAEGTPLLLEFEKRRSSPARRQNDASLQEYEIFPPFDSPIIRDVFDLIANNELNYGEGRQV